MKKKQKNEKKNCLAWLGTHTCAGQDTHGIGYTYIY